HGCRTTLIWFGTRGGPSPRGAAAAGRLLGSAAMSQPHWRDLGFLTPDAPDCQREVWALLARLQGQLAAALDELALRTAEPTWEATLRDEAGRARELRALLDGEAGAAALQRVAEDEALRDFEEPLSEVLASGHVPSLVATGYATLGELGALPARLLADVAGASARPIAARVAAGEAHRPLGRLFGMLQLAPPDQEALRRMLRHLDARLFATYATWRQTFHVLGVDGETLEEEARRTVRAAREVLGLKTSPQDLSALRG